jgi:hypothetical protein
MCSAPTVRRSRATSVCSVSCGSAGLSSPQISSISARGCTAPFAQRQRRRQRPQPAARERHRFAVVADDERAAEDPETHPIILNHGQAPVCGPERAHRPER